MEPVTGVQMLVDAALHRSTMRLSNISLQTTAPNLPPGPVGRGNKHRGFTGDPGRRSSVGMPVRRKLAQQDLGKCSDNYSWLCGSTLDTERQC